MSHFVCWQPGCAYTRKSKQWVFSAGCKRLLKSSRINLLVPPTHHLPSHLPLTLTHHLPSHGFHKRTNVSCEGCISVLPELLKSAKRRMHTHRRARLLTRLGQLDSAHLLEPKGGKATSGSVLLVNVTLVALGMRHEKILRSKQTQVCDLGGIQIHGEWHG